MSASEPVASAVAAVEPVPIEEPTGQAQRVFTSFATLVRQHLVPVLQNIIEEQRSMVKAVDQLVQESYVSLEAARQAKDQTAFFKVYTDYNQAVYELITPRHADNTDQSYAETFADLTAATDTLVRDTLVSHTEVQSENRFARQPGDRFGVRFLKFFKRQHRASSLLPWQLKRLGRRMVGKTPPPRPVLTYQIPLRNLTRHHFQQIWALRMLPILSTVYQPLAANTLRLWRAEDEVYTLLYTHLTEHYADKDDWLVSLPELPRAAYMATMAELCQALDTLEQAVIGEVEAQLAVLYGEYQRAYERVGTVELPTRRYRTSRLLREQRQLDHNFLNEVRGWRNTLYALYEDWRIDQEINLLCTRLFEEHARLRQRLQQKIAEAVLPHVDRVVANIEQIEEALVINPDAAGDTSINVRQLLKQQREAVDFQLIRSVIPTVVAVLYRQALPATIAEVYQRVQEAVGSLADRRALVSTNEYDQPVRTSDINYISPKQIVSFESLPKLRNALENSKTNTGQWVSEVQKMVTEIGQVSYFNLDSALSQYETESAADEALATARDGLERACKNTIAVKDALTAGSEAVDTALREAIKEFNADVISLKQNDYALEIKLRIAKAKALERTQALKQRSLDYVQQAVPRAIGYTQQQYQRAHTAIDGYRQRMGLATAETKVTTEVSDFLNDTETAIDRLPYVYQRLFGNRALEEPIFFEERTTEIAKLQKAYHNWGQGRFASTVLVGERGGGTTTLINFFLKKLSPEEQRRYDVVRVDHARQVGNEEDLLTLLNTLFQKKFATLSEAADYLCAGERKRLIVWENIQRFFLRKVGGFVALKSLFELISRTHQHVYWVCTCTQYAWDFLHKTAGIADYFEYIVPLEEVSHEQLREAILRRHRVSGYRIRYAGSARDRTRKKFVRLNDEQKQAYLEQIYFEDLKQLTAGNYSIAQLYWLRSTQQVHDDTITISSLQKIDFSFTQSIPLSQMLILHNLLLHDGLSKADFQAISERKNARGTSDIRLELMQLCDDGLVKCQEDSYIINPLLYRQIVQLLRNKNFLH